MTLRTFALTLNTNRRTTESTDKPKGGTMNLESEQVVVQSPMSFAGSARRIRKVTRRKSRAARYAMASLAVCLVAVAWVCVLGWYLFFSLTLVPYRRLRRGQRQRRRDLIRHREALAAASRPHEPRT